MASNYPCPDPFRQPSNRQDKYRECCETNKPQVEKGNKYGQDELKVYIRKQKELRKTRELQEFEERERLLESKKKRLRELDIKCKQIASKNQVPPFPVPQPQHHQFQYQYQSQTQQNHHNSVGSLPQTCYQHQQTVPHQHRNQQILKEVREREIFLQKFASQTVTSTTMKNNLPPINDRERNTQGKGKLVKPKLKRTKYTNQDLFSTGHNYGHVEGGSNPSLVSQAKKSKSTCKLERHAANFIFKEFEHIVRRECKNLLRTRSSQFQSLSAESSTSLNSNSNSKSEVNLHFREPDRDRERGRNRDRDRDPDSSNSNSNSQSHSNSRDNKERKSKSKTHSEKRPLSASATNSNVNHHVSQKQTNHNNHNHRSDRDRDRERPRERERERVVTKVDKNVGTSFNLYDSFDRRDRNREVVSSDGGSSMDVDADDSHSQVSNVNRLATAKGYHSFFQQQMSKNNDHRKSLPAYITLRPGQYIEQQQQHQEIPQSVKNAAASRIQAAYKGYKIRSILSEAKLRSTTGTVQSQSSTSHYGGGAGTGAGTGTVFAHRNGHPTENLSSNSKYQQRSQNNTYANSVSRNRPVSPPVEFSSGDSCHDTNVNKSNMNFYKLNQNQRPAAASLQLSLQKSPEPNQNRTRSQFYQPTPEKPYDERSESQRHISASALNGHGGSISFSIPRPPQQSPAHTPVKPKPEGPSHAPNPEDIPGYIPPPAGYGYSPTIPRPPSYSPRTLPLLRLRNVDEPFPKQVLENLDFNSSQHNLSGACQSPVKLISSISKFQMPYSLQQAQASGHGHGQQHQQQQPMSSAPAAPVTFIPKPSSHPPSFLIEAKNRRVAQLSQSAVPSSLAQGQSRQQQSPQQQQATQNSFKRPTIPTMSVPVPASISTLTSLPDPVFTTVLQEKIRLLRNSQNQPGLSVASAAAAAAGPSSAAPAPVAAALKSPVRRSTQMNAVSKATEQIKKKIVEAKQILEDYKMELLQTNSSINVSQLYRSQISGDERDSDITYESDFDADSQSQSMSVSLSQRPPRQKEKQQQQDQRSLSGADSDFLQSFESDVDRERKKEMVAQRYTIPRPSSIGSITFRSRSRSSGQGQDKERGKLRETSTPTHSEHTEMASAEMSKPSSVSKPKQLSPSPGSFAASPTPASQCQSEGQRSAVSPGSGSRSRSKSISASVGTRTKSTVSQSVQASISDVDIDRARVKDKDASRSSTSQKVEATEGKGKPVQVKEAPSPSPKPDQHDSETDYEEIAPTVSRASSNLPTEDIVYDMDFDSDSRSRSVTLTSKSKSKSTRLQQQQQQQQQSKSQQQSVQQKLERQPGQKGRRDTSGSSLVIDLDIASGKSDELPSEHSLSISLSLNAQGQLVQGQEQRCQKDMEDNLPSILSSIAADEIASAAAPVDIGVDESIIEEFEVEESHKSAVSSASQSSASKNQLVKNKENRAEPPSKDTTVFDEKMDTNLSASMASIAYDFEEDFETDASVSQSLQNIGIGSEAAAAIAEADAILKRKPRVDLDLEGILSSDSVAIEVESDLKDDTIIDEEEVEASLTGPREQTGNDNEIEIEDSFLSEILEDVDKSAKSNSVSTAVANLGQSQIKSQPKLTAPQLVSAQKKQASAIVSTSSMSEISPVTGTYSDTDTSTTANQIPLQPPAPILKEHVDISGKIVEEMDSILSDASNIPDDHHHSTMSQTGEDKSQSIDVSIHVSEKSQSKKSQDQSTQKSNSSDFSQQANFNGSSAAAPSAPSPPDQGRAVQIAEKETETEDPKPLAINVPPSPVPTPVMVAASDEEMSEIPEDLPSESELSASESSAHQHSRSQSHSDGQKQKPQEIIPTQEPEPEEPEPAFIAPAAVATTPTWDAELSVKSKSLVSSASVSQSESKKSQKSQSHPQLEEPLAIEVQTPAAPPINLQTLQSPPLGLAIESPTKPSEHSEGLPEDEEIIDEASLASSTSDKSSRKSPVGYSDPAPLDLAEIAAAKRKSPEKEEEHGEVIHKSPEMKTSEVSTQSEADPDSFLASIAFQVSEILSKSSKASVSKSKSNSKASTKSPAVPTAITPSNLQPDPLSTKDSAAEAEERSIKSKSVSSKLESAQRHVETETQDRDQEDKDKDCLLDLAKTMDTDIIEKIESLLADEISKQMELEEKEKEIETEPQSTNSQATEIDADDSKYSLASYSNFHVEDVVYESDFDSDVRSQSEKSGKSKSEKTSSKSKSNKLGKAKHSGLLEAVVKNEVELLVKGQSEKLKNEEKDAQEKTGDGDFIRNATEEELPPLDSQQLEPEKPKQTPKLGVEARVQIILQNKETMDGLVTRIIARMLKEVSLARSEAFKGFTNNASPNTSAGSKAGAFSAKDKDGLGNGKMMQVPEEDENDNDDNSVSTHDEVDVDGDAEWFEDDLISGAGGAGNSAEAEDESLKREAAEIVAEQMRIENEIRALEALQAAVPATLMNLSDVPDKPPPPYSPPSSDSASLGLRSFAIQYTQKQLQDLIHSQVDRIWDEWSSTRKLPQYDYVDDSEDFPLRSLPSLLEEAGAIKDNEEEDARESIGGSTQNIANNKKEKEMKDSEKPEGVPLSASVPVPVLSTRAFNTLLFDLIKDTIKDILLIEDQRGSHSTDSSIRKDYVDRIRPGSLAIEAQKMRIPKTKEGLFRMIYMRVKNLLPYPLLANDVPVPRRRLTKWTSRPRDLVDEVLAEELIEEDREWTESWPEEILVIDRWSEKFSRRAVREVVGAFKAVFTTTTSV